MTDNIITAVFGSGMCAVTTSAYRVNNGMVLRFSGVELPTAFEVDFSNYDTMGRDSITAIGQNNEVQIPDDLWDSGLNIYAYVYLHPTDDSGVTVYTVTIPVLGRPNRTEEEPTPHEQSVIEQAISALNDAVEQTAADVVAADASASAAAQSEANASVSERSAAASASAALASQNAAESASQSATESASGAAESASGAAESAESAAESAESAAESAESAAESAESAYNDAERAEQAATTATGKATEAATSATTANGAAQTATGKAAQAEQSATAAANSSSAAATSASNAAASATAAQTAQTAAETAQGKAEDAQAAAEAAAQSVSASAAQIAKNTDNFASAFSASTTYAIGDYCIHEGTLYRFTSAHTGTWSASDVEATNVGGEIGDVKSAIASVDNELSAEIRKLYVIGKNLIDPTKISSNTILYSDGTTATVSGYNTCDFIPIESGQSITFNRIRKFIAYDTDKAVVLGSLYDGAYEMYTYTATEDGYVRASVADGYLSTWQAEYGTSATPYEAYQRFLAIELGETPLEQVADLIAEAGVIYLMEDITPASGYTDDVFIKWDDGGTSGNSTYRATPQINIIQYTHILYTRIQLASASAQTRMGMAFASKSAYISGQVRLSGSELKYIPTLIEIPEGAVSARFTEHKSLTGFSIKGVRKIDVKDIAKNSNILFGKKWAACGDSFTNGALSTTIGEGKYSNKKVVYPYLIGNRNEMQIIQFFGGGRTLAFPANPGTFTNSLTNPNADYYYQNIPADVDYITIYLGINDEHHAPGSSGGDGEDNTGEIPIGTIEDTTTATYLGAWNVVLTWLITNRPNAHIGIIVTNGIAGNDEYRQGQIAIAQKYGIPYIDMNGDSRTPAMLRTSNPNIPTAIKQALVAKWAVDPATNTHPNDAAHLFESYFIEDFLRSI